MTRLNPALTADGPADPAASSPATPSPADPLPAKVSGSLRAPFAAEHSWAHRTIILVSLACVVVLSLGVWRELAARNVQLRQMGTSMANLAAALTQEAESTVRIVDTALLGVVDRLEVDGISAERLVRLNGYLTHRLAGLPGLRDIAVLDEHGQRISGVPEEAVSYVDRDYFIHHSNSTSREPFIGHPIRSHSTGAWVFTVSRRYQHPDGRFAGIVVTAIDIAAFADAYAQLDLGRDSSISLVNDLGIVYARYPENDTYAGMDWSQRPLFIATLGRSAGSYVGVGRFSGVTHVSGFSRGLQYPLTVWASTSVEHATAGWAMAAFTHLGTMAGLCVLSIILGSHLFRHLKQRHASELMAQTSFRQLAESTTDVIIRLDLDLRRTYASPACRVVHGYEPEEMVAMSLADQIHAEDSPAVIAALRLLASGKRERDRMTYRIGHRHGGWVQVETSCALPRDPATGNPAAITMSIRDISERFAQTEKLSKANGELETLTQHLAAARDHAERANLAKTRFLASMSHELRTPLAGVLGYANLLRMDGGLTTAQLVRVEAMLAAGAHLLGMINHVLDLSDIEREGVVLQHAPIDLQRLANDCLDAVRPAALAKGLQLSGSVDPSAPLHMTTDPTRLRQVLLNLLGNAVKFTAVGSVELRLRPVAGAGTMRFEVADTGPGVPASERHRLFQDFKRLDNSVIEGIEGSGLGLAIAARMAGSIGGQVAHENRTGGGSVFSLELPLTVPSAVEPALKKAAEAERASPATDGRSLHVLVVDDMAMNREIATAFLQNAAHTVIGASSGLEALASAADEDFDVVLMDVRMPGIDGLEATRRIRALGGRRGQVPIVALTAQAFADQVAECHAAGMDAHLAKPFAPATLLTVVADAAANRRQDAPERSGSAGSPDFQAAAADMLMFDISTFETTTSLLSPDAVAGYLRNLQERCEALLAKLPLFASDPGTAGLIAEEAHSVAGSAGMFGYEHLSIQARTFEHAVQSGSAFVHALADGLIDALNATVRHLRLQRAGEITTPEQLSGPPGSASAQRL